MNLDFFDADDIYLEKQIIAARISSLNFDELESLGKTFFDNEINNIESKLTKYVSETK